MSEETLRASPPQRLLPALERTKQAYLMWHEYHSTLPKIHRYTIGEKIDTLLIEIMEAISGAAFMPRNKKLPFVSLSLRKLNTITLLLLVLWEAKSLRDKKYIELSLPLDEIGKMLNGWQGQILRQTNNNQNSPEAADRTREK